MSAHSVSFRRPKRRPVGHIRPQLLRLEDRRVPAVFIVSTTADDGPGSLRAAVQAANNTPGADLVRFEPAVFGKAQTIQLLSPITISDSVSITGPGAINSTINAQNPLTISGQGKTRLFKLDGPGFISVQMSNLRLVGGFAEHGGAILNAGELLQLSKVEFAENSATVSGGAIAVGPVNGGKVSAEDVIFRDNQAGSHGGAIAFSGHGSLSAVAATFNKNSAGQAGGAISVSAGGSVSITASTFSFNKSDGSGGALHHVASPGNAINQFVSTNSTWSGNFAKFTGGAVELVRPVGEVVFRNSTIINNVAGANDGLIPGLGGGVRITPTATSLVTGSVVFISSIVSQNGAAIGPDVMTSAKAEFRHSALGSAAGIDTLIDLGGNLPIGAELKIGPLLNNGGPTLTHLPLAGSPLINTGINPAELPFDQRGPGFPARCRRPGRHRFGRTSAATLNLGWVVDNPIDEDDGNYSSGDLSLREAIRLANEKVNAPGTTEVITFSPVVFAKPTTIELNLGQLVVSDSVLIRGPGAERITISGGGQSRLFKIDAPRAVAVQMTGLKLTGGSAGEGGAIFNVGQKLSLGNVVVIGNKAAGVGGAIATFPGPFGPGSVVIEESKFAFNWAGKDGGAVQFQGPGELIVRSSEFGENTAGGRGGAIRFHAGGRFTSDSSTLANNSALIEGGGVSYTGPNALATTPSQFLVRNSTLSGNSSRGGGAVALTGFPVEAVFANSTLTNNKALNANATLASGGGVRVTGMSTTPGNVGAVVFISTVISQNFAVIGPDVLTPGRAEFRHAALGSKAGIADYSDLGGNLPIGVDVRLAPLANNGGPTRTHLPLFDSPLINTGINPWNLPFDQRGPGFPRVVGGKADIGSVERALPSLTPIVTPTPPVITPTPAPRPGPSTGALYLAAIAGVKED